MFKRRKAQFFSLMRNSQHGQSVLILALGFIALASFVGLVTDISIMFVRFSTLRQAVDAAAIAAAGQVREGTSYATVALSARQYITLHGLEPHRVWVETCETDIAEWRRTNPEPARLTDDPATTGVVEGMPETELCNWANPRKLVKVTAQINSQTTFLRLIGINDFVITASSTSETAQLDVVLVLDTSFSMGEETRATHFTAEGMTLPNVAGINNSRIQEPNYLLNNVSQAQWRNYVLSAPPNGDGTRAILRRCITSTFASDPEYGLRPTTPRDGVPSDPRVLPFGAPAALQFRTSTFHNYSWGGCCNDPGGNALVRFENGRWLIYTDVNNNGTYQAGVDINGIANNTPDNRRHDLVCQPFRQVKEAARNFIAQLDFVRGDRVALVTFDRTAQIVWDNGYRPNIVPAAQADVPIFTNEPIAINALSEFVGIGVNPSRSPNECDPNTIGNTQVSQAIQLLGPTATASEIANQVILRPYSYSAYSQCGNTNIGDGVLLANQLLTNASTIRRNAVWVAIILSDGAATAGGLRLGIGDASNQNPTYPLGGFCPWVTFCNFETAPTDGTNNPTAVPYYDQVATEFDSSNAGLEPVFPARHPIYEECVTAYNSLSTTERTSLPSLSQRRGLICNDQIAESRHFCLEWTNNTTTNGMPNMATYPDCAETGLYDADDYGRDMADWAGLVTVSPPNRFPEVPGNFIAMFSIGFGDNISNASRPDSRVAAPLLRYIADAGDNGFIDNNLQQSWRSAYGADTPPFGYNGPFPSSYGDNDPCHVVRNDPTAWCGQYYYASDLASLNEVFEAIASRLFTRLSR